MRNSGYIIPLCEKCFDTAREPIAQMQEELNRLSGRGESSELNTSERILMFLGQYRDEMNPEHVRMLQDIAAQK
jgi:hypothetical protein